MHTLRARWTSAIIHLIEQGGGAEQEARCDADAFGHDLWCTQLQPRHWQ